MRYADGAEIGYDVRSHTLTARLPAGGKASVEAPGGLRVIGDVRIEGRLQTSGDLTIGGKADVDGDVKGAGISLSQHVHPGVQSGAAKTLAPLP